MSFIFTWHSEFYVLIMISLWVNFLHVTYNQYGMNFTSLTTSYEILKIFLKVIHLLNLKKVFKIFVTPRFYGKVLKWICNIEFFTRCLETRKKFIWLLSNCGTERSTRCLFVFVFHHFLHVAWDVFISCGTV